MVSLWHVIASWIHGWHADIKPPNRKRRDHKTSRFSAEEKVQVRVALGTTMVDNLVLLVGSYPSIFAPDHAAATHSGLRVTSAP